MHHTTLTRCRDGFFGRALSCPVFMASHSMPWLTVGPKPCQMTSICPYLESSCFTSTSDMLRTYSRLHSPLSSTNVCNML